MKILVPVIVGAVIGYITNWVAIKMLFRPHEEKRIFGFHVPFTPGLIPKEKSRIAKSVGGAVGEYLLSPDIIVESVCANDNVNKNITTFFSKKILSMKEEDASLGNIFKRTFGDKYLEYKDYLIENIVLYISSISRNKVSIEAIKNVTDIKRFLNRDNYKNICIEISRETAASVDYQGVSLELNEKIKSVLNKKIESMTIDERRLSDVIPETVAHHIKDYIMEHKVQITEKIGILLKDESISFELKRVITHIIEKNLGKIVTMFMNPDAIGEKVLNSAEEYLAMPSNQIKVAFIANEIVDKALENKISDSLKLIPCELKDNGISKLQTAVEEYITDNSTKEYIENIVLEKLISSEEAIKTGVSDFICDKLMEFINSSEFEEKLKNLIVYIINDIENIKTSEILKNVNKSSIDKFINTIGDVFKDFIIKSAKQITEVINISGIVENRINSFEVAFAEKIILEIASKELSAITWLGGLLGALMGLLTPLLQTLYR